MKCSVGTVHKLIESSLNYGLATLGGEDLYQTLEDKISMISYSFINELWI